MSQTVVAISSDFFTAFAALPRQIQGKVTEFINKFRNNPKSPGINYEKIHDSADKKMWSVRIDDTYRGIVVDWRKAAYICCFGSIIMMRPMPGPDEKNAPSIRKLATYKFLTWR